MVGTLEREYHGTHPWLAFRIDLKAAPPELWMLIGEARSNIDHLAGALLKPETADTLYELFLAKGAHATTAIEGNTLSEETVREIVGGRNPEIPPSQAYLAHEVINIVNACNRIKDHIVRGGTPQLTQELIEEYNRQVLDGLELNDGVVPGRLREHSVTVATYRGAPARNLEYLVDRLCTWLNGRELAPPAPEWNTAHALIRAVVAHLYLAWIHPFGDGNGRTARLVELQILLGAGIPAPAGHLLSNHYNETRAEYYRQLRYASESGGDVVQFLLYAVRGFVDNIRRQLELVRLQQLDARWEQYIYETFGRTTSAAQERRRELVLELSKRTEPVPRLRLTHMSPALAEAYAGSTTRKLSRDLNALRRIGLVERVPGGFEPNRDVILAFLPLRRDDAGAVA